jgi:transposase-like protein
MKAKRYTTEEKIRILREADSGKSVVEGGFRALGPGTIAQWQQQSSDGQQWCEWYNNILQRHSDRPTAGQ